MKKSNLLLLAGFLAVVLLVSFIHITLYAKYKSGDFTIYNPADEMMSSSMQPFPNIAFVSVRNVPAIGVKFSDVAQVETGDDEDLQYTRSGDTLVISTRGGADEEHIGYHLVYLPRNATLSVFNSSLYFKDDKATAQNSPVIYLKKSRAFFSGTDSPFRMDHVKVVASDSSTASFHDKTHVNHLEVQLSNSAIEYTDGDFGQLSITTDSLSRISLQSKHLLKANIKTIAPE